MRKPSFIILRLAIHAYSQEDNTTNRLNLVRSIHSAFKRGVLSPLSYNHLLLLLKH
jgi:hypothetical protein